MLGLSLNFNFNYRYSLRNELHNWKGTCWRESSRWKAERSRRCRGVSDWADHGSQQASRSDEAGLIFSFLLILVFKKALTDIYVLLESLTSTLLVFIFLTCPVKFTSSVTYLCQFHSRIECNFVMSHVYYMYCKTCRPDPFFSDRHTFEFR